MTTLLAWTICWICTFLLAKSFIEKLFSPYGGIATVCRRIWLEGEENTDEDTFLLDNAPDSLIEAILLTLLLIASLIFWPFVLSWLVFRLIFKPDMSEFEEMFK